MPKGIGYGPGGKPKKNLREKKKPTLVQRFKNMLPKKPRITIAKDGLLGAVARRNKKLKDALLGGEKKGSK